MMQDSEGNVFFQSIIGHNIGIAPDGRIITDYVQDKDGNRIEGRKIINQFGQTLEIKKRSKYDDDEKIFLLNNGTAVCSTYKSSDEYFDGHDLDCDTLKVKRSYLDKYYKMVFCHLIFDEFDDDSCDWDYDSGPYVNSGLVYPKLNAYEDGEPFSKLFDTYSTRIYCFNDNKICKDNNIFKFTQYMGYISDELPKFKVGGGKVYSFQNYLISNALIELIDSPVYSLNRIYSDKIFVYEIKNKGKLIKAALH
jgi:hypothetical protein